ncbi:MAG: hypothetical protein QOD99_290 [Chthoniobacter sp.]|nr:hypothetical protein [Chthoniobacter sp.]
MIVLWALTASLQAAEVRSGDRIIEDVSETTRSLTINSHGQLKAFHLPPSAEITVNGNKSSVHELAAGMRVTAFTLSDASTIRKLDALGSPKIDEAALAKAKTDELVRHLSGTYWSVSPLGKVGPEKAWCCLNADGTAVAGWHEMRREWKAIDASTIRIQILGSNLPLMARFDPDLTSATTRLIVLKRISSPDQSMKDKVARGFASPTPNSPASPGDPAKEGN